MVRSAYASLDEITFRPFLLWYLIGLGLLFMFGGFCLLQALYIGRALGWAGVALAGAVALVLVLRFNARAVIVRGTDLILCTGVLAAQEYSINILQANLRLRQSLLGRLFDYATVFQYVDGEWISVAGIASARALRFIVADRREQLRTLLLSLRLLGLDPYAVPTFDRGRMAPRVQAPRTKVPR